MFIDSYVLIYTVLADDFLSSLVPLTLHATRTPPNSIELLADGDWCASRRIFSERRGGDTGSIKRLNGERLQVSHVDQ
jgi:hypothetical protein